jgi:hypothetical protein
MIFTNLFYLNLLAKTIIIEGQFVYFAVFWAGKPRPYGVDLRYVLYSAPFIPPYGEGQGGALKELLLLAAA